MISQIARVDRKSLDILIDRMYFRIINIKSISKKLMKI
jgi:hypothetical protein